MTLRITNTLTRQKEDLSPREPGHISMYVCGPTVYNHIHIGNARSAVVFDVIRRYLSWSGLEVDFVQNYTDIDDKIIDAANAEGVEAGVLAAQYSKAYEEVMAQLNISPPTRLVRATEHITDMIAMIETLIAKGSAYESSGNVWFKVESFPDYGKLSGRSLEDMRAGERVEPDPSKQNPMDFALWKTAKPGEPSWESPWGNGRPGWHIECSAMSAKYLGMGFDIHGGGSDLIFPHHENEIAQAEAATGEHPFVRVWLHNGMLNIDQEKMSKSLGNFVTAKDVIVRIGAPVVRLMSIAAHYRSEVDFGETPLQQAKRSIERFENLKRVAAELGIDGALSAAADFVQRFREAMDDDFNTPLAISVLHDLVKTANSELDLVRAGDDASRVTVGGLIGEMDEILSALGILLPGGSDETDDPERITKIDALIEARNRARAEGRYDEADDIRTQLGDIGVVIEDSAQGTRWRNA